MARRTKLIAGLSRRLRSASPASRVARAPEEPYAASRPQARPRVMESVIWPDSRAGGGELARAARMRVLVVSGDRHFRSVTSVLLAHRGCSVSTTATALRAAELLGRDGADAVVIDGGRSAAAVRTEAAVCSLAQPVGIVIVDEAPGRLEDPRVFAKWGPFEELFAAIECAARGRAA